MSLNLDQLACYYFNRDKFTKDQAAIDIQIFSYFITSAAKNKVKEDRFCKNEGESSSGDLRNVYESYGYLVKRKNI